MGGGHWDVHTYTTSKATKGPDPFTYTASTRSGGRGAWKAHDTLDPARKATTRSPFAGKVMRESRDNPDHPNSTPVVIAFDDTGSMGNVPRVLQTKLAELFGLLISKGYATDPQILIGAYGDAFVDKVPLQMGEFESDNRIDTNLENLFLEGGGGGNNGESAALAWYFAGAHTATDAWDKHHKKGYLFTIGDEVTLDVTAGHIIDITGENTQLQFTPKQAADFASERWHVFHLIINNTTAQWQRSVEFYTKLLGDNAIVLENENAVAETIAGIIGLMEGNLADLHEFTDDLTAVGAAPSTAKTATKALAKLGDNTPNGRKAVGTLPDNDDDNDGLERI